MSLQENRTDIYLGGPEFIADPYPTYARLRRSTEPYWYAHNGTGDGLWLVTRYEDVAFILKGAPISKDGSKFRPQEPEQRRPLADNMLDKDPPDHTRLRSLVNRAFTPKRVRDLKPRVRKIVDDLIGRGKRKGHMEFIADFALPLPAMVIAELLGVPPEDRGTFHGWSNAVIATLDVGTTERAIQQRMQAEYALSRHFKDLIRRRRREPREDLISALIRARDDHHRLTEEEMIAMCMLLLVAGHETTVNLLGNGLFTLLGHPAQLGQLMDNPQLIPSAIEEMLRFESPIQRALFRLAAETFTVGTTVIERGQQVSAIIGAANRDPDQFAKPDTFDITREPNRHLAFGRGIHYCLGAPLARLEAKIAFTSLFEQLPDLQLVNHSPDWNSHTVFRGLKTLPVTF